MKQHLNTALLVTLLLAVTYAVISYGAATLDMAGPLIWAGIALALIWATKLLISPQVSWIRSPIHWPVLGFVGYAFLRYLTSPIAYDSRVELVYILFYALIYFVVAFNLYHRRDLTFFFLVIMGLALVESVYGIWQASTYNDRVLFSERPPSYTGRASGTFVNPNHMAAFLAIVFGLTLARVILHRPAIKATFGAYAGPKILEGYVILVALAGIVASGSRACWIALGIGLVAFLLWAIFPGAVSKYVVLGLGVILILGAAVIFNAPSVRQRVAELVSFSRDKGDLEIRDATLGHRTIMWTGSTKMIAERPIFGSGPGTWEWFFPPHRDSRLQEHARNAHNDLLQMTAEYGLMGLLLVSLFFAAFFWHTVQLSSFANYSDQRAFAVGAGFGISVALLHSLADFHFHVPAVAMLAIIAVAMTAGMESGDDYSKRVQMERRYQIGLAVVLIAVALLGGWTGLRMVSNQQMLSAAEDLQSTGDFDEAMQRYQQLLQRDSRMYAAERGMGEIYLTLARKLPAEAGADARTELCNRAIAAFDRGLKLNARDADALAGKAESLWTRGSRQEGLAVLQQALALDPNNRLLITRLGFFFRDLGDRNRAIEALKRAFRIQWTTEVQNALVGLGVDPEKAYKGL